MSINSGDFATSSRNVSLSMVWPQGATSVLISNDGGFNAAGGTRSVGVADTINWTISADRPATVDVYVRYLGAGQDTETYSDNIYFDKSQPKVASATIVSGGTAPSGSRKASARQPYRVKVVATETHPGIAAVQLSATRAGGKVTTISALTHEGPTRLNATLPYSQPSAPRFVRVESSAGVWSAWFEVSTPSH